LQDPYTIGQAVSLPIYYASLDKLTSMFTRRADPIPTTLAQAYFGTVTISTQLGQTTTSPRNHIGPIAMPNQIPMRTETLWRHTDTHRHRHTHTERYTHTER